MKNLLLSLCLALLALPAFAASDWNMVGSAGEIDESCLTLYDYSGARLRFKSTSTGTIVARYPVTNTNGADPTPNWSILLLNSMYSTVTAKLMAVAECDATEEQMCSVTGTSNNFPGCTTCIFGPEIDFRTHSYYIEVTLTRSTTTPDPTVIMISLGN